MLSLTGSLGFSSLNIFGALGSAPVFRLYQTDEFRHTLLAAANIVKEGKVRWRFQDEIGMDFFGFAGAILSISNTLATGSPETATGGSAVFFESLALAWTAPVQKSLLGLFYDWLSGKALNANNWPSLRSLAQMEHERLRRETLTLAVDSSGDAAGGLKVSAALGHESLIRIFGRLTLSAFVNLNCVRDQAVETLSVIASVGTTLNVSF
jgi:hypothetical protein